MRRNVSGRIFVLAACGAGIVAFSGAVTAQESLSVPPLDEAGAEEIALADAGVEEADAQRLRAVREREDGEDVIEVEFSCGDNSYEYMLRESDGMILEWSIEGRPVEDAVAELTLAGDGIAPSGTDAQAAEPQTEDGAVAEDAAGETIQGGIEAGDPVVRITADGTELVGYEQAMQIALADSGIAPEDAEFDKIKFEYDGRFYNYELELREGRAEYEYKIDAQTGVIVEIEHD